MSRASLGPGWSVAPRLSKRSGPRASGRFLTARTASGKRFRTDISGALRQIAHFWGRNVFETIVTVQKPDFRCSGKAFGLILDEATRYTTFFSKSLTGP